MTLYEFEKLVASPDRPPQNPVPVCCLVCEAEFSSNELQLDENCKLWVCPYCQKGHTYGQEIIPINQKGDEP